VKRLTPELIRNERIDASEIAGDKCRFNEQRANAVSASSNVLLSSGFVEDALHLFLQV